MKKRKSASKRPARVVTRRSPPISPSEAEQTLEALRTGLIDALVITEGQRDSIYALRTFEELEASNAALRTTQERLLVLLNERERLMQDLHDGCIQSIYAVGLALEDCRSVIAHDPVQAAHSVARAVASLNLVIQELRGFISGTLSDAPVDLPREIARIIDGIGAHGPQFRVDISRAAAKALAQDQCAQLLQITREALSNIVRHAHAKSARIALKQRGKTIRLDISDDGKGFDTGAQNGPGLGLHHISARVQRLGGALHLESKPRGGCRVVVELAA